MVGSDRHLDGVNYSAACGSDGIVSNRNQEKKDDLSRSQQGKRQQFTYPRGSRPASTTV